MTRFRRRHRADGPCKADAASALVYVEGARDRDVLLGFASVRSSRLVKELRSSAVILGGRRPARAQEHFAARRADTPDLRALCLLDRDLDSTPAPDDLGEGIEAFMWTRRHIESYLLIPDAIRRGLRTRDRHGKLGRLLREHLPAAGDEARLAALDAKRLLAPAGPIARELGRPLPLGRIARATLPEEHHEDVAALLDRLSELFGTAEAAPTVFRKPVRPAAS